MKAFKTIFLICIFYTACCFSVSAQWLQLNSGTTNLLYEVHFPATDTGYVVGGLGTILKTTDGGANWITLNSGTTTTLRRLFCKYSHRICCWRFRYYFKN